MRISREWIIFINLYVKWYVFLRICDQLTIHSLIDIFVVTMPTKFQVTLTKYFTFGKHICFVITYVFLVWWAYLLAGSSMASLHLLGQDNRYDVQHGFFGHVTPFMMALALSMSPLHFLG